MDNFIHSDAKSSTTRQLTKEKPVIACDPTFKLEPKLFLTRTPERGGEGGLRTKGLFKKSIISKPLISVVTVVYNGEKSLEQTIQSVLEQTYDNVEYIIVDGGSTDQTVEIIKKYEEQIDYWISEPDNGIYDAMNKGASLCSGHYIAFLNADDWYNDDTLSLVAKASENGSFDFIAGDQAVFRDDTFIKTFKTNINKYQTRVPFGHPSLFVKRTLLLKYGLDKQYPIAADYDFMIKIIKQTKHHKSLSISLSNFRLDGISTTTDVHLELFKIQRHHFGLLHACRIYMKNRILKTIRPTLSRVKKKLLPWLRK